MQKNKMHVEGYDDLNSSGFDMRLGSVNSVFSSTQPNQISFDRHKTHRIYDISNEISTKSFTKICQFQYSTNKKGIKSYQPKKAELKLYSYQNTTQSNDEGDKVGNYDLNLTSYINKGVKAYTYSMNKENSLFLTVNIYLMPANENHDVASFAIDSFRMGRNQSTAVGSEESDESEEEINGDQFNEHFQLLQ